MPLSKTYYEKTGNKKQKVKCIEGIKKLGFTEEYINNNFAQVGRLDSEIETETFEWMKSEHPHLMDAPKVVHYMMKYLGWTAEDYINKFPELRNRSTCICGKRDIKNRYYICDVPNRLTKPCVIMIGCECRKLFSNTMSKICPDCGDRHSNIKYIKCSDCLTTCACGNDKQRGEEICSDCDKKICPLCCGKKKTDFKYCWKCTPKRICEQCPKTIIINKYNNYICYECKFGD